MQRWFFNADSSAGDVTVNHSGPATLKPGRNERIHKFRVLVNQHTDSHERVAVTGECSSLGQWMPDKCVQLNRENDSNIWSRDVVVPANQEILYRYLICTVDPATENIHVRRWETHSEPRKISADLPAPSSPSSSPRHVPDIDTFGDINGHKWAHHRNSYHVQIHSESVYSE